MPPSPRAYATLFVALVFVSTAGPFLRMAAMNALAMAFWRLALAGVMLLLIARATRAAWPAHVPWRSLVGGAVLFAAHLALWVKAFDLTDYASNLVLLVAQPVMAAFIGHRLGERHGPGIWVSVALAAVGLAIVAGGDFALGPRALLGDLVCIVAGLAIALFYVVSKPARAAMPIALFTGMTFVIGALLLVPWLIVTGAPIAGYPTESWIWLAALVVVTTVAGHALMNRAARDVSLFTLNVVIVLEPAIGIGMGAAMFGATVSAVTVAGGAVLAIAVVVGLRASARVS